MMYRETGVNVIKIHTHHYNLVRVLRGNKTREGVRRGGQEVLLLCLDPSWSPRETERFNNFEKNLCSLLINKAKAK